MKVDNNPDGEVEGSLNKAQTQGVKACVDRILMEALNVTSIVLSDLKEFEFVFLVKI